MGRFTDPQDPLFQALNSSIRFDYRLAPYDLEQSRAHARMLARSGIISDDDLTELESGLDAVREEIDTDTFVVAEHDEDIHMAIERRLTEIVGPVGGKLHTARSRNDQVATDVAMLVRAHSLEAKELLQRADGHARLELAEGHMDWRAARLHAPAARPAGLPLAPPARLLLEVPARPPALQLLHDHHGRPAARRRRARGGELRHQPHVRGAGARLRRHRRELARRRLEPGLRARLPLAPPPPAPRHLSQLGAEIVLWSTQEFGFCEVSDSFASGSSLMPQKKNPDAAELLRAKAPRVASHLVALHGVLHGLPLTYNKDLQEDKEPLFDTVDTLELCLRVARRDARGHRVQPRAHGGRRLRRVHRGHRRRRPARPPRGAVPRGARDRRRRWCAPRWTAASSCRSSPRRSCSELAPQLDGEFYELLDERAIARVEGVGRRHRAWRACATSSPRRGRCSARQAREAALRALGATSTPARCTTWRAT